MFIELTSEQRALQAELRQYFSTLITLDEAKAMESDRHNEAYRAVIKRMGSDGKLGVGWPTEYGGLASVPSSSRFSSTRPTVPTFRCLWSRCRPWGPPCRCTAPRNRRRSFCPESFPATSISRSVTPSPTRVRTWPRCGGCGHRGTAGVAGHDGQAQPGHHVRRRGQRGDARDDCGVGTESA